MGVSVRSFSIYLVLICSVVSNVIQAAAPSRSELIINQVEALAAPAAWQQDNVTTDARQILKAQQLAAWQTSAPQDWAKLPIAQAVPAAGWLKVQLHADRYNVLTLKAKGFTLLDGWLNGATITPTGDIPLPPGDHQLLLWVEPAAGEDSLKLESQFPLQLIAQPTRLTEQRMQQKPRVSHVDLSPDGRYAMVGRTVVNAEGQQVRQLELRQADSAQVLQHWAAQAPAHWLFSPDSQTLAYLQDQQLVLLDIATGKRRQFSVPATLSLQQFLPAGSHLVVQLGFSKPLEPQQLKHLTEPDDRFVQSRDSSQLMLLSLGDGSLAPLPELPVDSHLVDISPDQQQWLIQSSERTTEFPYTQASVLSLFEPQSKKLRRLGQFRLLDQVLFADAEHLWVVAGPNFANAAGKVIASARTANDYDGQLYRYRLKDGQVEALSRNFDPGIIFMYPQRKAGRLLLWVTDREHNKLYSYQQGKFQLLDAKLQHVEQVSAAEQGAVLYVSSGAEQPAQLVYHSKKQRVIWQDDAKALGTASWAKVQDLKFDHPAGHQIPAHYYLPTDFDPARRYPLIVYYYGGTIPESKSFWGPYPFQQWAAAGYVVLVVQPRGAVGYGQDYSAWHPNDWGQAAGDDIQFATKAFLKLQPAVDAQRIGHIGASYGGFMTMYLASHSQLFKAGVAHAGISTLSSYWGQGRWGIGYSNVASAGSYPWNNSALYAGQSPLFHADKIQEALLLTAGDADDNVPYAESIQMYNALKLLGKPVEMVSVPGEGHSIRDPLKRRQWLDRIQAFFDWHLKDQPQWWQALEKQS